MISTDQIGDAAFQTAAMRWVRHLMAPNFEVKTAKQPYFPWTRDLHGHIEGSAESGIKSLVWGFKVALREDVVRQPFSEGFIQAALSSLIMWIGSNKLKWSVWDKLWKTVYSQTVDFLTHPDSAGMTNGHSWKTLPISIGLSFITTNFPVASLNWIYYN